jgi:hypothetical protein
MAIPVVVFCLPTASFTSDVEPGKQMQLCKQTLHQAMRYQQTYDVTATTNAARFQANVILYLVQRTMIEHPEVEQLLIPHDDWFKAFLQATKLTDKTAPCFARLAHEHRQDLLIDLKQSRVIKRVKKGRVPRIAVTVTAAWSSGEGLPSRYTFEDTLSQPKVKVTNHRRISYRLLDFGDMIVYDDIQGLTGRPKSGLLAALFRLIGEGRIRQSRFMIANDGLLINRVHAKKGPFGVKTTVTIHPDGRMTKGLPEGRPDVISLERKLKKPLEIQYYDAQ